MTNDHLRRVISAQTSAIDHVIADYNARGVTPPREFVEALYEIQRLAEEPVVDLAQNLCTMVWEAADA